MSVCHVGAVAATVAVGSVCNFLVVTAKTAPNGKGHNFAFMYPNQYLQINKERMILTSYQYDKEKPRHSKNSVAYGELIIEWRDLNITYYHINEKNKITKFHGRLSAR